MLDASSFLLLASCFLPLRDYFFLLHFEFLILMSSPVLTIDVAHPPRHPDQVEQDLIDAWEKVRNSPDLYVLKVIHGHGSSGKGGSTRETVRNWAFRQRRRLAAVIPGEEYGLFSDETARMRREVGAFPDPDLDAPNPGVTILWIKEKA